MTSNNDSQMALRYHHETSHSLQSLNSNTWQLDWSNRPLPYKIYTSLEPLLLPGDFAPLLTPAFDAIASAGLAFAGEQLPNMETLARLCFFANGITKRWRRASGQVFELRAAACTGALYHIEVYIVCGNLPGLAAGVYHFGAHDNGLRQLRAGDFRQVLVQATGNESSIASAPAMLICTSTFWRNAWKYQDRAYRHTFWDDGTILANFLAEAVSAQMPVRIVLGFVDEAVNHLLAIDGQHEAAVNLIALGHTNKLPPESLPPVAPLHLSTQRLSPREYEFPLIPMMHAASSLLSGEEVAAWREQPTHRRLPPSNEPLIPLRPLDTSTLPNDSIEEVIKRRGSTRQFTTEAISFEQLSTMLVRSLQGIPADCLDTTGRLMSDLYLIAMAVDGLEAGTYVLHQQQQALELLKKGDFRQAAYHLALDQDLGGNAAVNIYFMADLEPILERFGNRGYRVAQLEAAIVAGKLYLAAYALHSGATGLTFFDDEVTAFFSPHAARRSVMFLMALGQPLKKLTGNSAAIAPSR
jgi:SagB-type dehydrogenase family enzyme